MLKDAEQARPQSGGRYIRQPDGTLLQDPEEQAVPDAPLDKAAEEPRAKPKKGE